MWEEGTSLVATDGVEYSLLDNAAADRLLMLLSQQLVVLVYWLSIIIIYYYLRFYSSVVYSSRDFFNVSNSSSTFLGEKRIATGKKDAV
jgi:hypothetical protein